MSHRICLLLAVAALLETNPVGAALPHWRLRRSAPYPSDTYAPEMRDYTVIEPVVVGTPPPGKRHAFLKDPPPPGQILWRQHVVALPNYPWGWFGARRHVENSQQTRFNRDARDWSYLRGD